MAKSKKLDSPASVGMSDDYRTQDDMNTLMRHNQLVNDSSRHSKVIGIMRDIVSKCEAKNSSGRKSKRINGRTSTRS